MGLLEDILNQLQWGGQQLSEDVKSVFSGEGGMDELSRLLTLIPGEAGSGKALKSVIPAMGAKVFKPAKELPYLQQLQSALESYLQPGKLQAVKNRLQPALKIAEGEPSLTKNLMVGPPGTYHNALYEQLQSMPGKSMEHGYFDPEHKVFLDDVLNSILYDPDQLKTVSRLLKGGLSLDSINEAMGFRKLAQDYKDYYTAPFKK